MEFIKLSVSDQIASITLNRAEKRNALNPQLITELTQSLKQAEADPQVKVVILQAAGPVFSAGADLAYLQQLQGYTLEQNIADSDRLKALFLTMHHFEKVLFAKVEGNAIAGGCGLASACDIVFAVPEALFGYTEVKIGFVPAIVATFLLRKIGEGRTRELLLSGELISAQVACNYNLVNFISDKTTIEDDVAAYARKIVSENSGQAIKTTKSLLAKIQLPSMQHILDEAATINAEARLSDDCKKGIDAFLNKTKPKW